MHKLVLLSLLLPVVAPRGHLRLHGDAEIRTSSCGMAASPASVPTFDAPAATLTAKFASIELREAPDLAPINQAPAAPANSVASEWDSSLPVTHPVIPVAAPVSSLDPPTVDPGASMPSATATVITTLTSAITSTRLASPGVSGDFVTTQWMETWIGGTSQTWVPKTITFHFAPIEIYVPPPGRGSIGMGTLTGETGKTQTIIIGAAPSQAAQLIRGIAAAVGVGIAGMVV
ncbi:hypothetical protein FB567DRAFT_550710 [Paraphoma chrysanthemicola]|uniref:Uncharacterized protein n=1 Tax=Paraphoma chrysanthemicola TaxID=798071 RepID=A0A8K0R2N3_9PLEO|nr:hypothetical protein FB567DRAFT_550710 [Paraphoma chrysanthemicola]